MGFAALEMAIQIAKALRVPVERIRLHDRDLADQLKRAVNDLALAMSEGSRREGRDRMQFFRAASGSASEARTAVELALAWGIVDAGLVEEGLALLDRELAMLWRLLHPKRR